MIFLIIGVVAGIIGGFMAQEKGKNVFLWFILCTFFPIALIILAFKAKEEPETFYTPQYSYNPSGHSAGATNLATISAVDSPAWKALKEFDADIKGAIAQLSGLGREAEERLASAYLAVNDKSLLPTMIATIIQESKKKAELKKQFEREIAEMEVAKAKHTRQADSHRHPYSR